MNQYLKRNISKLGPLIGLVVFIIVLAFVSDNFFTVNNMLNLLRQVSINGLIAFGMTFVILTGGIDLSVGSMLALGSALTAGLLTSGIDPLVAIVTVILFCLFLCLCDVVHSLRDYYQVESIHLWPFSLGY